MLVEGKIIRSVEDLADAVVAKAQIYAGEGPLELGHINRVAVEWGIPSLADLVVPTGSNGKRLTLQEVAPKLWEQDRQRKMGNRLLPEKNPSPV